MLFARTLLVVVLSSMASQQAGLKIIVIAGEDAVNVVQQKTAVAPIVEVRDRNNQPVPGAIVTFTIQGARHAAFAGGSPTLTVTTNAAGRAAASALSPLSNGAVQIQVQAAFQGQTVAATIAQTNVMTSAEAAGASSASGASGASSASGASGAGGINGLAIAGIAGGVGAGALVAVSATQNKDEGDGTGRVIDPAVLAASGTYALQQINGGGLPAQTVDSPPNPCPGFTDNGTVVLKSDPQVYDINEASHTECRIGTSTSFQSTNSGTWTLSAGTITFSPGGGGFNPGQGTLRDSTLTFDFDAPHANTGNPAKRVNAVWRR